MINDTVYDIAIIGGGISSSVFVSTHIKNGFKGKIAIIENGRNLGGRASTRISFINSGWKY
jgi:predicted NAD/FAD-dependent oxidoreductase